MSRKKNSNGTGSIRSRVINGRRYWEGRYTDPAAKKQISVSATSEKECVQKLKQALAAITMGTFATPDKITVEGYITQWISGKKSKVQASTYTAYQTQITKRIIPTIGHIRLQDLRRSHCQRVIDAATKEDMSYGTVRMVKAIMVSAFGDAVRDDLLSKNPASYLSLPDAQQTDPVAMDDKLIKAFIAEAKKSPFFNVFMIQFEAACRISEALGLRWQDVNLQTGRVDIKGQLAYTTERGLHFKPRTKTGKPRTLYLPAYAIAYLKDEKKKQNANKFRAGEGWNNRDNLVFTKEDGSPHYQATVGNAFKKIMEKLGHPGMTTHVLRKTYITQAIAAGVDPKTVSVIAGHSAIDITLNTYTAKSEDNIREVAAKRQQLHDKGKS